MSLEAQARLSMKLQAVSASLGEVLDELAGEHVLFSLLVWQTGPGHDGRAQYVSNAEREGVIASMHELLARWESTGGDDGPYHVFRKGN